MSLFKSKNNIPALYILLDKKLRDMKENNQKSFYYPLFTNEVNIAQKWCNKNNMLMEIDHKTDNNIFYKFIAR